MLAIGTVKDPAEHTKKRNSSKENRQREVKARKSVDATHKLFGALHRHDEKAVLALLAQGADIHASNDQGQTASEYARSLGLQHLMKSSPNKVVEGGTV